MNGRAKYASIGNRKSQISRALALEKETACILPKQSAGGKMSKSYFFFFLVAANASWAACVLAARCWNLSTRPAVSTNFCWPV
jgi:hypothetical protein